MEVMKHEYMPALRLSKACGDNYDILLVRKCELFAILRKANFKHAWSLVTRPLCVESCSPLEVTRIHRLSSFQNRQVEIFKTFKTCLYKDVENLKKNPTSRFILC